MLKVEEMETQLEEIDCILELIYQLSGYDFREYARRSLHRRLVRYLNDENLDTLEALRFRIIDNPQTLDSLVIALTIDFSSMFRDTSFFSAFRSQVVPLLRDRPFIRVWHAGCASGEEVYSMAILLDEEGLYEKTRIYATDMNPAAIQKARRGIFPISRMKEFTRNYLESGGHNPFSDYYTAIYNHAILRPALRKNIVWAQHNLTCDQKFNDFDVIICRNVLIYFNQVLKDRVQGLFFDSLQPGGVLGLGTHETLQFCPYEPHYLPLSKTEKIFVKRARRSEQQYGN